MEANTSTGARTVQSAATPELTSGLQTCKTPDASEAPADWKVRAPSESDSCGNGLQRARPSRLHRPANLRNRRSLSIAVVIALCVLFACNLLIHRTSRSSQRRQFLAALDHIPAETDCVFLGNSLIEAGCDPDAFKKAWPDQQSPAQPFNLGLGATYAVEHYIVLKHLFERGLHLRCVIYGFSDDQLIAPIPDKWSDLIGNRALSCYFADEAAELYVPGSPWKRWQLRLTADIPMLVERSSVWGKVEYLRWNLEQVGMPRLQTNRFGRVENFARLEKKDLPAFKERCSAAVTTDQGFSRPVLELLRLAAAHGTQLILVEMPRPSNHRAIFHAAPEWLAFRAYVQREAAKERALYISASDWISDDAQFMDATHLNDLGAKNFSAKLAVAVYNASRNSATVAVP